MIPVLGFFIRISGKTRCHHCCRCYCLEWHPLSSEKTSTSKSQSFSECHSVLCDCSCSPGIAEFLTEVPVAEIQSCIQSLCSSKCQRSARPISWSCPLPGVTSQPRGAQSPLPALLACHSEPLPSLQQVTGNLHKYSLSGTWLCLDEVELIFVPVLSPEDAFFFLVLKSPCISNGLVVPVSIGTFPCYHIFFPPRKAHWRLLAHTRKLR